MSSGMWREIQNCGPTKIDVMENFKKRSSYSYTDKTDEFVAHLLVLPDEVVIYILSYLRTLTDIVSVSETCHRLHLLSSDNQLWYPLINCRHSENVTTACRIQAVIPLAVASPHWLQQQEIQPDILAAHMPGQSLSATCARPGRRLYLQIARQIGAKRSLELSHRLMRHMDVNIWHDMCVELNRDLNLKCEIRNASDRLLAASVNSLIRHVVSLEDPWSSLPEDNITLFCALQTLLPQKLILKKLVEVVTVDAYSLHGFSTPLTSIDLLMANRGQVPLAAVSQGSVQWPVRTAARVCSVCGRNVEVSPLCIAKDNIREIRRYVQLRVVSLIDFWLTNYGDLMEEANILPDLQCALQLPCWLHNIPTKSLIAKCKQGFQQQLPLCSQLHDFDYIFDTTKCVKDTAIRLTREDLQVYQRIPNIELQRAALWSEDQPYNVIMSQLPYLGRVDHKARTLTESVVTHLRAFKLPSKTTKKSAVNALGKSQASCIHHCIRLCSELHKLKNFVSLRALLVAIRSCMADPATSVSWKIVSYQDCKMFQRLEQLIVPTGNYSNYVRFVWEEQDKTNGLHYLPPFLSKKENSQSEASHQAATPYQQTDIAGIPVQHLISSDAHRAVFPLRPIDSHLKAARTMIDLKPLMLTK